MRFPKPCESVLSCCIRLVNCQKLAFVIILVFLSGFVGPFFLELYYSYDLDFENLQQLRNFTTVQVFLPYQFEDPFQFLVSLAPR